MPNAQSEISTMFVACDGEAVHIRDASTEMRGPTGDAEHQLEPSVRRNVVRAEKRIASLLGLRSDIRIVHLEIGHTPRVPTREGFQLRAPLCRIAMLRGAGEHALHAIEL